LADEALEEPPELSKMMCEEYIAALKVALAFRFIEPGGTGLIIVLCLIWSFVVHLLGFNSLASRYTTQR
jgi:hypothetical protein